MPVQPKPAIDHVVHPLDPASPGAAKLRTLSDRFTAAHDRFVKEFAEGLGKGSEADREMLHRLTDRAGEYSLNLNRYWSEARDFATEAYRFGKRGDEGRLSKLDSIFKDVDRKFEKQLKTWEEITSPAADEYDADQIHKSGDELRETIEKAREKIKLPDGVDAQSQAESVYLKLISASLAGLAEQVGSRLAGLGGGKSVELVTMSSQTKEVLERAKKDPPLEQYTAELKGAEDFLDRIEKNTYTAKDFADMWVRQAEIREQLKDKNLKPEDAERLRQERTKISSELDFLKKAADRADKSKMEQKAITTARDALTDADTIINRKRTPDEIRDLLQKIRKAAEALTGLEASLLPGAAQATKDDIAASQTRLDEYKASLSDARSAIGADRVSYWGEVKDTFLSGIETVAGKELKKTFDKVVFDSDLSGQLGTWKTEAKRDHLDPLKLQKLAADLAETLNSYSKRVELEMRKLGDDPAAVQVRDQVQAGLAALRESLAKELQFLFDHGAFRD